MRLKVASGWGLPPPRRSLRTLPCRKEEGGTKALRFIPGSLFALPIPRFRVAGAFLLYRMEVMRAVLLFPALFLCACATDRPAPLSAVDGEDTGNPERDFPKSYSRESTTGAIREGYMEVLDVVARRFSAAYPQAGEEHAKALREFILRQKSAEQYAEEMMEAVDSCFGSAAESQGDSRIVELPLSDQVLVVNIACARAMRFAERQSHIYVAQFVEKNPIRLELFGMDGDGTYTEEIVLVYGEATHEQFSGEAGANTEGYQHREGDRFFGFYRSENSVNKVYCKRGYLVVRDGAILRKIVTVED